LARPLQRLLLRRFLPPTQHPVSHLQQCHPSHRLPAVLLPWRLKSRRMRVEEAKIGAASARPLWL